MREQLRRGRLLYISFILLDILCLIAAVFIAVRAYQIIGNASFSFSDYYVIVIYMAVIDVVVTAVFNTLSRAMRRQTGKEVLECLKHVAISMLILTLLLFSMKQGADFSRITTYLAYAVDFVLMALCHMGWKRILKQVQSGRKSPAALLITTAGYASEGISVLENSGIAVKGMFLTDKTNEGLVGDIPVMVDRQDAAAFICWEWVDKIYICGPDSIDVPDSLIAACQQMEIPVYRADSKKGFEYEVIKIRTALQKDDKESGLSFFEGEHDIPFRIGRLYTIFESEQEKQSGFHAHKQSWHLLFCPYGSIDVIIDTGRERKTVSLNSPSTGLILHPGIWREMIWRKTGSVLCVAASGHYDAEKLRNDYGEYLKFLQEKEWSAAVESAEIMGEQML